MRDFKNIMQGSWERKENRAKEKKHILQWALVLFVLVVMVVNAKAAMPLESSIKARLIKLYNNAYKDYDIKIHNIEVSANKSIDPTASLEEFKFNQVLLKRNSGEFSIIIGSLMKNGNDPKNPNKILLYKSQVQIEYELSATITALKAKENIKTLSTIDASNAEPTRIDLTFSTYPYLLASRLGKVSARSFIARNAIIYENKVRPLLLVKRGQMLDIAYKQSNLSINYQMRAVDNGGLGDIIKVKNEQTNKIFEVRIIGPLKGELL